MHIGLITHNISSKYTHIIKFIAQKQNIVSLTPSVCSYIPLQKYSPENSHDRPREIPRSFFPFAYMTHHQNVLNRIRAYRAVPVRPFTYQMKTVDDKFSCRTVVNATFSVHRASH